MNLFMYFMLFIIYSFIGWCIEVSYTLIYDKKFVNRGFLIGPYCPIYGYGCIFMIILLKKYTNDLVALFIMAVLICSILEYGTSFIMEKLFKTRWWDYSNKRFNINGRICLETMVPFGILGIVIVRVINPLIMKLLLKIPSNILIIIAIVLFVIFLIDNVVSFMVISKIKVSANKLKSDSTEEITKKVREYVSNYSKFGKRLIKSFPNIKINNLKKK